MVVAKELAVFGPGWLAATDCYETGAVTERKGNPYLVCAASFLGNYFVYFVVGGMPADVYVVENALAVVIAVGLQDVPVAAVVAMFVVPVVVIVVVIVAVAVVADVAAAEQRSATVGRTAAEASRP